MKANLLCRVSDICVKKIPAYNRIKIVLALIRKYGLCKIWAAYRDSPGRKLMTTKKYDFIQVLGRGGAIMMIENQVQCYTRACNWMIDNKCHHPTNYKSDPITCVYHTPKPVTKK